MEVVPKHLHSEQEGEHHQGEEGLVAARLVAGAVVLGETTCLQLTPALTSTAKFYDLMAGCGLKV